MFLNEKKSSILKIVFILEFISLRIWTLELSLYFAYSKSKLLNTFTLISILIQLPNIPSETPKLSMSGHANRNKLLKC